MSYISLYEASQYFATRLDSENWDNASDEEQTKALIMATRLIDRLNFAGVPTIPTQLTKFPRSPYSLIPEPIKIATCEIAINLLDGTDMEQEIENLFVNSQSYSTVTTSYLGRVIPDYMRAGIPSAIAWNYLRPYLSPVSNVSLNRV